MFAGYRSSVADLSSIYVHGNPTLGPGGQQIPAAAIPISALVSLAQVPDWAYERSHTLAERLRELLAGKAEVITPAERATLVAFRPPGSESAGDIVAKLADAGVLVREIPGTGLIRASVGWWTSEGDLDRLVGGL